MSDPKDNRPSGYFMIHDLPGPDGRSIRENNLDIPHDIPVGTLVEAVASTTNSTGSGSSSSPIGGIATGRRSTLSGSPGEDT